MEHYALFERISPIKFLYIAFNSEVLDHDVNMARENDP